MAAILDLLLPRLHRWRSLNIRCLHSRSLPRPLWPRAPPLLPLFVPRARHVTPWPVPQLLKRTLAGYPARKPSPRLQPCTRLNTLKLDALHPSMNIALVHMPGDTVSEYATPTTLWICDCDGLSAEVLHAPVRLVLSRSVRRVASLVRSTRSPSWFVSTDLHALLQARLDAADAVSSVQQGVDG